MFSKDESRVLTWSRDGTARLWAIGTGSKEPLQIFEHKGRHWRSVQQRRKPGADVESGWHGAAMGDRHGQQGAASELSSTRVVVGAVFSKDESRVLTWGSDGTARLWAIGTGSNDRSRAFEHKGVQAQCSARTKAGC